MFLVEMLGTILTGNVVLTQKYKNTIPRLPLSLRITTPKDHKAKSMPVYIDLTTTSDGDETATTTSRVQRLSTGRTKPERVFFGSTSFSLQMKATGVDSKQGSGAKLPSDMDLESSSDDNSDKY
jgi:hypothetical protein